ncbi:HAD family hydrolase [Actinomycetaceae bacterium L2_0104]
MNDLTTAMADAELPSAGEDLMIALDIDGTVLGHDGSLSERVERAIHAHVAAGTQLMLATGRGIHGTQLALEQIGLREGVAVCSNGAITLGLGRTFLPSDAIAGHPIIEPRSKLRTLDVGVPFRILNYRTFDPRPEIAMMHAAVPEALLAVEELDGPRRVSQQFPPGELSGPSIVLPVDQLGVAEATRLTVRVLGMSSQELLEVVDSMGMKGVEYAVGWTAWLDVSPQGISKASALDALRDSLGISPKATVAVGDGGNDLEMMRWAACGIAMEGAPGYVVDAASASTRSVHEDGLADVLEALL